jgi:PucR family transcriptional regulator, proline-responsive transcriptional activator
MKITKHVLLKEIESLAPTVFQIEEINPTFERLMFFNENQTDLKCNCLYICELNNLKQCILELKGYYFVCICDIEEAKNISLKKRCNIITINTQTIKFGELVNNLNYIFYRYNEWDHKLDKLILKGLPVQDLTNESEDFFENPFFVIDSTFRVIGNTNKIPSNNDYLKNVISQKSLTQDSIENLIKRKLLSEEDKFRHVTLVEPPNMANCKQYVKSIYIDNYKSATFVQFCINREPKKSDIDLIDYFVSKIEFLLYCTENKSNFKHSMYNYFIVELLQKTYSSEDELKKRAELLKMPYEGRYMLYKISFEDFSARSASFVLEVIKNISPFYRVTIYEQSIVIINIFDKQKYTEKILGQRIEWIQSFLENYQAYLGIGGIFHGLKYASDEYNKATASINIGRIMDNNKRVYWYKDYFIYHILLLSSEKVSLSSLYYRRLKRLIDMDKTDNTDNLEILRTFLENDRNITKTAKLVNLHRNSVLYRINKIQEYLNIDLESYEVRMRILLSFYALDLLRKMPQPDK